MISSRLKNTDRKNGLERLANSIEQCGVPFMITDVAGTIVYVNERMSRLTGYSREELVGKNPKILQSGKTPRKVYRALWKRILSGKTWHGLLYNKRKNGEVFLESIYISPVKNYAGIIMHFVGTWQDITVYHERESRLVKEVEMIKVTSDDVEQFAYRASHDLKAPLRKILTYTRDLIKEHPEFGADTKDTLRRMHLLGKRMQHLIERTLELSRVASASAITDIVDLNGVLGDVLVDLNPAIRMRQARIEIDDLPRVRADAIQMYQLFLNLVSNALKFQAAEKVPHIRIQAAVVLENQVEITVADNGIGIDPAMKDRLFMPFERLNPSGLYEGSGIGLTICKKIVERHGGRIWGDCPDQTGTVFHVMLPI